MKKIIELLDVLPTYKRCVVMGNSGSLIQSPRQDVWADDILFIGTNRMLRTGVDNRKYLPDILVISDSRAVKSEVALLHNDLYSDVKICVPQWVADDCRLSLSGLDVYRFEASTAGTSGGTPATRRVLVNDINLPNSIKDPLLSICNVGFHAVQLACLLNIHCVYLLGMEGRWPIDSYRKNKHHFYNEKEIGNHSYRPLQLSFEFHHQWQRLKEHFNNSIITDLTAWSDISALPFPKINSDVLTRKMPCKVK